eukprot:353178-Chlamydomonas_euryale.AAC.1
MGPIRRAVLWGWPAEGARWCRGAWLGGGRVVGWAGGGTGHRVDGHVSTCSRVDLATEQVGSQALFPRFPGFL